MDELDKKALDFFMKAGDLSLKRIIVVLVGIILLVVFLTSIVVIVPAGHVGIYEVFGDVREQELYPGLHFKVPWAGVTMMSVRKQEYTMTFILGEGDKSGSDVTEALTSEGLPIGLDMTIRYYLKEASASDIYENVGLNYKDVIVRPDIRSVVRDVIAEYEAKQIYSEERTNITLEISLRMEYHLDENGIVLDAFLLRNVKLPEQLTSAIEKKLTAEQSIQEKAFQVEEAILEAERKREESKGIAAYNEIIAESLSPRYLTWYWINNLVNHESVYYVPVGDDGIPLFKEISEN